MGTHRTAGSSGLVVLLKLELNLTSLNVLRFEPFATFDDFKGHHFSFVEGFIPLTEDGSVMHEDILSGFLGNETVPFFIIKPLDFTTGHIALLLLVGEWTRKQKKTQTGYHQLVSSIRLRKTAIHLKFNQYPNQFRMRGQAQLLGGQQCAQQVPEKSHFEARLVPQSRDQPQQFQ